jgi:hypothetical protein
MHHLLDIFQLEIHACSIIWIFSVSLQRLLSTNFALLALAADVSLNFFFSFVVENVIFISRY